MLGARFEPVLTHARAGNADAWRELYRDLAPSVDRYLRAYRLRDAGDVLGEVMVSIVRGLPTFEGGETAFRGWVFAIARNRATDEVRRQVRRPSVPVEATTLEGIGPVGDSEDEAMRALATARVHELLDRLTPEQREVLILRLVAGLTIDEIASALGRTPGAVKMLQARGIDSIRTRISEGVVTL